VQAFPQGIHEEHSDSDDDQLAHPSSHLVYKSNLTQTTPDGPADLYLIRVETMFDSPCIAVPYDLEQAALGKAIDWLIVEPRHRRMDIFRNQMKELKALHVQEKKELKAAAEQINKEERKKAEAKKAKRAAKKVRRKKKRLAKIKAATRKDLPHFSESPSPSPSP